MAGVLEDMPLLQTFMSAGLRTCCHAICPVTRPQGYLVSEASPFLNTNAFARALTAAGEKNFSSTLLLSAKRHHPAQDCSFATACVSGYQVHCLALHNQTILAITPGAGSPVGATFHDLFFGGGHCESWPSSNSSTHFSAGGCALPQAPRYLFAVLSLPCGGRPASISTLNTGVDTPAIKSVHAHANSVHKKKVAATQTD